MLMRTGNWGSSCCTFLVFFWKTYAHIWCHVVQFCDVSPHNFDGLAMSGLAISVAPSLSGDSGLRCVRPTHPGCRQVHRFPKTASTIQVSRPCHDRASSSPATCTRIAEEQPVSTAVALAGQNYSALQRIVCIHLCLL